MATPKPPLNPISPNRLYPLAEVKSQFGLSDYALRMARRNGLPIYSLGRQRWIWGAELIDHIRSIGDRSNK